MSTSDRWKIRIDCVIKKHPETGDEDMRYAWSESFVLCSIKFVLNDCLYVVEKSKNLYKCCDFCEVPGAPLWEMINENILKKANFTRCYSFWGAPSFERKFAYAATRSVSHGHPALTHTCKNIFWVARRINEEQKRKCNMKKNVCWMLRARCSVNYEAICMKIAIFCIVFFSFVICSSVEVEWYCLCFFPILVLVFTTSCC